MSAVWVACLGGFALLCLGALVVTSWVEQLLCARYERLARKRRELDEWRRARQETDWHHVWYDNQTASRVDGQVSAVTSGTTSLQEQFGQIAVW